MTRAFPLLLLSAASCSLLTNFDPDGQPCDHTGACLVGYACTGGKCLRTDGGAAGGAGGGAGCACSAGELCVNGTTCLPRNCGATTCATGAVCSGGACTPVPCVGRTCAAGSVCDAAGACQQTSCGATTCGNGAACINNGLTLHCVDVACTGLACPTGMRCSRAACVTCDATEAACDDGVDNNCNGSIDCADGNCAGRACDDGDPCTVNEFCTGTTCGGGVAAVCNTPPNSCSFDAGTCSLAGGGCSYPRFADATPCGQWPESRCCAGACVDISQDEAHCGGCGLACAAAETCISVGSTGCAGPLDTSGRCTCSAGSCPASQTCLDSSIAPGRYCSPQPDAGQCAAGEFVSEATVSGCPNYCSY